MYKINQKADFNFFEFSFSKEELLNASLIEENFEKILPYGKCEMRHWYFDGIRIVYTKHHYQDYYLFEKNNDLDVVSLEFNLQGNFEIFHHGNTYRTKSHQHNIIYTPGVNNTFKNGNLMAEGFKIQFSPKVFLKIVEDSNDVLKRFSENMLDGNPHVLAQESLLLTPELHKAIQDILNCSYTGGLKKMFLLSKSIEILVMQAEAFDQKNRSPVTHIKKQDDRDRIVYAKEYLLENMENPPGLSELSKVVGINEYKLKKGFKEMFKATVFNFLSDIRLAKAHQELLSKNKNIAEIAYDLGYSSPQHFSKAYKKKFGIPPRYVKR